MPRARSWSSVDPPRRDPHPPRLQKIEKMPAADRHLAGGRAACHTTVRGQPAITPASQRGGPWRRGAERCGREPTHRAHAAVGELRRRDQPIAILDLDLSRRPGSADGSSAPPAPRLDGTPRPRRARRRPRPGASRDARAESCGNNADEMQCNGSFFNGAFATRCMPRCLALQWPCLALVLVPGVLRLWRDARALARASLRTA